MDHVGGMPCIALVIDWSDCLIDQCFGWQRFATNASIDFSPLLLGGGGGKAVVSLRTLFNFYDWIEIDKDTHPDIPRKKARAYDEAKRGRKEARKKTIVACHD